MLVDEPLDNSTGLIRPALSSDLRLAGWADASGGLFQAAVRAAAIASSPFALSDQFHTTVPSSLRTICTYGTFLPWAAPVPGGKKRRQVSSRNLASTSCLKWTTRRSRVCHQKKKYACEWVIVVLIWKPATAIACSNC